MEAEFWLEKWAQPKQGWAQEKVNSRLQRYWPSLGMKAGSAVLVPLCGDSIDLDWLVAAGYRVCGAELSHSAIQGWSDRHNLQLLEVESDSGSDSGSASTSALQAAPSHWTLAANNDANRLLVVGTESSQGNGVDSGPAQKQIPPHFICGDFLKLGVGDLPFEPVAVYDRAALIALPPPMRRLYAAKLAELLGPGSRILLITLAYDQQKMNGPPFSVMDDEVESLFSAGFSIEKLGSSGGAQIVGNLSERGLDTAGESVFLITRTR